MSFFKGLLIFLGGAIVGVGGTVGGVYIAASTMSVSGTAKMFGADLSAVLKDDYANLTITEFVKKVSSKDLSTLGGISEITPMVDNFYNNLDAQLQESLKVTLDKNAIYTTKFENLGAYLVKYIKDNAPLGGILNLNADSNPALLYLAYPKNDDGTYNFSAPRVISDLSEEGFLDNLLNNATLGDLLTIDSSDSTIYALRDTKINELEQGIQDLELQEVVDISATSPLILQNLADTKVGQLPTAISSLTLADVIEINNSSSKILKSLADTKVDQIGGKIDALKLGEMIEIDNTSPLILQNLEDSTLATLEGDIENLKITDVFASEIWGNETHDIAHADSTWRYMLTDSTGTFHTDYKLCSDMDELTTNVKYNVNAATMDNLYADGFISGFDPTMLNKTINSVRIGDMTFAQFITAVNGII